MIFWNLWQNECLQRGLYVEGRRWRNGQGHMARKSRRQYQDGAVGTILHAGIDITKQYRQLASSKVSKQRQLSQKGRDYGSIHSSSAYTPTCQHTSAPTVNKRGRLVSLTHLVPVQHYKIGRLSTRTKSYSSRYPLMTPCPTK